MESIKILQDTDIGKFVVYDDWFAQEQGIIKSFSNDKKIAWVVYKCWWDRWNYKSYTWQSTQYEYLFF